MSVAIYILMFNIARSYAIGVPNQSCVLESHKSGWTDLKKIAVRPDDGRFGIEEGAAKVGLSEEEASWIRHVTGNIICRDPVTKELTGGSATVFERNDQIVTASHVLLNENSVKSDCHFLRKTEPPVWRKLMLSSKRTIFGTKQAEGDDSVDFALVQLDKPFIDTKPVKMVVDPKTIDRNQPVILVSAGMLRMKRDVKENEPIVQRCMINHIDPIRSDASRIMHSNCSTTKRASGSMSFVRGADGKLYGAGILVTADTEAHDGKPYDYFLGHTAASVVFDDLLRSRLKLKPASF